MMIEVAVAAARGAIAAAPGRTPVRMLDDILSRR
jgi:hypothetical protein